MHKHFYLSSMDEVVSVEAFGRFWAQFFQWILQIGSNGKHSQVWFSSYQKEMLG